jgi:CubicO group peptidase (beta-lactamase class C family)
LVPDFLNDEEGILNDYSKNISKRYSVEEIVAYAMQRYPLETPGYSTTNFVVGEFIVEAVTCQKIEKVIEDLVFGPLGLENMELPNRFSDGVLPDPAATTYLGPSCLEGLPLIGLDGGFEVNQDISEFANGIVMVGIGGAINSNIYDLLAWAKSGTGDDLLTEEMVQRRHETHPYGIALAEIQSAGSWYGHDGATFGYNAKAWRHGSSGASFAGALNTCGSAMIVLDTVWVMYVEELLDRDLAVTLEPSVTVAPSMTPAPSSTSEVSPTASPGASPTNPATSLLMEAPTSSAQQNVMKAMWSSLVILGSLVLHLF